MRRVTSDLTVYLASDLAVYLAYCLASPDRDRILPKTV